MLLKPEPLKGLDWLNPVNTYNRDFLKNLQQLYSQKLMASKKTVSPETMVMRYLCGYGCNAGLEIGGKSSVFKPYQKQEGDIGKANDEEETENTSPKKPNTQLTSENFTYTLLRDCHVASFNNGGEKLLCLPQILNLLKHIELKEISNAMNSLGIACVECDEESLAVLQKHNIIPKRVTGCGLISQSNAERLLKYFRNEIDSVEGCKESGVVNNNNNTIIEKCCLEPDTYHQIRVTHDCFGQQRGILFPLKYSHPNARCIECLDCGRLLSPRDFVGHTHQDGDDKWSETQICHWGFDSSNWRWYLRLSEDFTRTKTEEESLNEYLDEIKKRFCTSIHGMPPKRCNSSTTSAPSFTENYFKSFHVSGAVFEQCIARINKNNLTTREEKMHLLNALYLLRQEHLQQINNLISERQQLLENFQKKTNQKENEENKSDQLLQDIKSKTTILKREQIARKRRASENSDSKMDDDIAKSDCSISLKETVSSKKCRISSPLTIECCDSSGENGLMLDSPNTNTVSEEIS